MRTIGRILGVLVLVAMLVAVVGSLVVYLRIRHDVDRPSLSYSVAARLDGFASCRPIRDGRGHDWTCVASPEQAPDVGPWAVTVAGHCWRAQLERSVRGARGVRSFRGCVGSWDQLRLGDAFGSFSVRLRGYY